MRWEGGGRSAPCRLGNHLWLLGRFSQAQGWRGSAVLGQEQPSKFGIIWCFSFFKEGLSWDGFRIEAERMIDSSQCWLVLTYDRGIIYSGLQIWTGRDKLIPEVILKSLLPNCLQINLNIFFCSAMTASLMHTTPPFGCFFQSMKIKCYLMYLRSCYIG